MTTQGNGGERISYTTKELLAEIKEMVSALAQKIDATTAASSLEVKEVRHRVANLEAEKKMQVEFFKDYARLKDDVEELREAYLREEGASTLHKVVVGLVGVAIINLVFNLIQQVALR